MAEAAGREKGRDHGLIGLYVGLFAALALVGLACWQWPVAAERWYCYRYEKTQDSKYIGKLARLGEKHPELPLSRWFFLTRGEVRPEPLRQLFPLSVRQKALRLWLKERLKGDWWAEKEFIYLDRPGSFPGPRGPDDWMPSADVLKEAMRRMPKPPASTGMAIFEFYEVCVGLAFCGDDAGLPFLEDQLFNGTGCFPDEIDAITDCYQGPKGVVALAAHGNRRARRAIEKALTYRGAGARAADEIEKALEAPAGYRAENLEWLKGKLAEFEKRRAAEREIAAARYRELAADLRRASSAASIHDESGRRSLGFPPGTRLICRDGVAVVERVTVRFSGEWELYRAPMSQDDYAAFWKEILEFDLWSLPESIPSKKQDGIRATYRAGDRFRQVSRPGDWYRAWKYRDEPATWIGALVEERLRGQAATQTGRLPRPVQSADIEARWLRGEPWEEMVKATGEAAPAPLPNPAKP